MEIPESSSHEDIAEVLRLVQALNKRVSETRLQDYKPYPFQRHFHNVKDLNGDYARQKFLQAANQIGKTYCAAAEFAMHVTGRYPDWYAGHRIDKPVIAECSGVTNETTRDIIQAELFGDPDDPNSLGTGTIPKSCILETFRKPGIPNAFSSVTIRHINGHKVTIRLKAYEAGFKKFMGSRNDVNWLDEEPPPEIWSQVQRSQFARPNSIVLCTFTPETGLTTLVNQINEDIQVGQGLVVAAWEDAPHIADVPGRMEQLLAKLSPHEREMRSKGIPMMGSGLIFPISDDRIVIDPIPIPDHWPRINGMDFGWDHPMAVGFVAYDPESDTVYLYDEYCESKVLPPIVASAIKARGDWIPVMWPHDGMSVADKNSGKSMKKIFEDEHINMHDTWFTNPPPDGEKEGSGGNSVEPGLMEMLHRMETGRFKVFSTCTQFLIEKGKYHRKSKNGVSYIVKVDDDLISAVRYAVQSLRHARTQVTFVPEFKRRVGARNW